MEDSDLQPTQSADLIGSNDDLLTAILLRLPVTSILRFKSVSKHWRWLLSDRSFTLMHDNLSKSPGIFVGNTYFPFDVKTRTTPPFHSLSSCFSRCCIRILQSCNGLLLLCCDRGSNGAPEYYVFNPTTKQFATIPPVPGGLKVSETIRFMCLAFHQIDCVHYKVVCIRALESREELFQIQVYSSDTRKWKISVKSFFAPEPTFEKGVYWNGAVYWAPSYDSQLYFKLDVERLQTLPLPVEMMPHLYKYTMWFGESRGHLHLVVYNYWLYSNLSQQLDVYEMLSDHSGWFVKYQVERAALPGASPERLKYGCYYDFKVIDVVRSEEEEEDTFIVLANPWKVISYNVHDQSCKVIACLPGRFTSFNRYTETLASF